MTLQKSKFNLEPTNFAEALKFAELLSTSSFVPKQFYGKPADILLSVQMGMELGLKPLQAIQNIAIINGKPSIYGDALLALVKSHPQFIDIIEKIEDEIATCIIKRKDMSDCVSTFSKADAIRSRLWGKAGPWTEYPSRMLQMRARGFCLRDAFPDALVGFITLEEARDYNIIEEDKSKDSIHPVGVVQTKVLDNETENEILNKEEILASVENLIKVKNVPEELLQRWCAKGEVENISQLPVEKLKLCLDFLVAA